MSEPEHETDDGDEAAGAPVSPETAVDDEQDTEEAEEAETGAGEPAEASAPRSEKEIEKANKALEREATAHANRISKIMGEDAQGLVPCELCWPLTPGFHWPAEAMPLDETQRDAVLAAIGMGGEAAPHLKPAKGVRMCEVCDGWGELSYPTKREHTATQSCPRCIGKGYVDDEPQQATQLYVAPPPTSAANAAAVQVPACPLCGMAGMAGQPHFCNPASAAGGA